MRHGKGWRRKGILWDYNGDGVFPGEKIPRGFWKRYWSKWLRKLGPTE